MPAPSTQTETKTCQHCDLDKPIDQFYKRLDTNKRINICIPCERERGRERSRLWYQRNRKLKIANVSRRKKSLSAAERLARRIFRRALASGEIVKPDRCESCGFKPLKITEISGHHPDLIKEPKIVKWLCSSCHGAEHRVYEVEES